MVCDPQEGVPYGMGMGKPTIGPIPKEVQFVTKDSGQRENFATGAVRDVREGKGRYDLLPAAPIRRWAAVMERGAKKYAERNWEKGMPVSRCLDSALRHIFQYIDGQTDEDHIGQAFWNIGAVIHFEETRPDLMDLPARMVKK